MKCREKMKAKSSGEIEIYVDKKLCTGCGICVRVCPERAIAINKGKAEIRKELCKQCLICMEECPFNAIKRR